GPRMKYWDSLTASMAASSSRFSARYCGFRSSRGTFMPPSLAEIGDAGFGRRAAFVVLEVPVDEAAHPGFDRRVGLVAHVFDQILHVGLGVRHVARLQREQVHFRLATQALLDHLDIAQQLHGPV